MKRSFQIAVGTSRFLRSRFVLLTLLYPAIVWASTYAFVGSSGVEHSFC
jgi:hypothetical protein